MGKGIKKQLKQMQQQMFNMQNEMQKNMEDVEVVGESGNGLVKIGLNGLKEMTSIVIQPDCVDPEDVEGLQDLIRDAYSKASKQLDEQTSNSMPAMPSEFGSLFS